MEITIGKEFKFDAAHHLPLHKGKCAHLHGHTYTMTVELKGQVDERTGMLVDFYDLNRVVSVILDEVDHKNLNDLYDQTTVEYLTHSFAGVLLKAFPKCSSVSVQLREGTGGYARASLSKERLQS